MALTVVSLKTHSTHGATSQAQGSHGVLGTEKGQGAKGPGSRKLFQTEAHSLGLAKGIKDTEELRPPPLTEFSWSHKRQRGGGPRTKLRFPELVTLLGLGSEAQQVTLMRASANQVYSWRINWTRAPSSGSNSGREEGWSQEHSGKIRASNVGQWVGLLCGCWGREPGSGGPVPRAAAPQQFSALPGPLLWGPSLPYRRGQ